MADDVGGGAVRTGDAFTGTLLADDDGWKNWLLWSGLKTLPSTFSSLLSTSSEVLKQNMNINYIKVCTCFKHCNATISH